MGFWGPANGSVSGARDEEQIDDQDTNENECADYNMQGSEAKDLAFAREIRRRDVALRVMVAVIGFGHRRNRIGKMDLGLRGLRKTMTQARSGMVTLCGRNHLLAFGSDKNDACDQNHDERNSRGDYNGEKSGVPFAECRCRIVVSRFDLRCFWACGGLRLFGRIRHAQFRCVAA